MARLAHMRTSAEFRRVKDTGEFWRGRRISLNAARTPAPAGDVTRFGLIATKRVGGAVQRNRARRIMREAIRSVAAKMAPDWDLVFIAQPGLLAERAGMLEAQVEVVWLLSKARIIAPN